MRQIMQDGSGLCQALRNGTRYFQEQQGYMSNLFRYTYWYESFLHIIAQIHIALVCVAVQRRDPNATLDSGLVLMIQLY